MNPIDWGPSFWKILHIISLNYPDKPSYIQKKNIINFFTNLSNILPCNKCCINYKKKLKENPIENSINNKNSLMKWVIDLHNNVNKSLKKPLLTYEQALNKCYDKCSKNINNSIDNSIDNNSISNIRYYKFIIGFLILVILLLLLFILKKYK